MLVHNSLQDTVSRNVTKRDNRVLECVNKL